MDASPRHNTLSNAVRLANREIPVHEFRLLSSHAEFTAFDELVEETYRPLQFLEGQAKAQFLPTSATTRYGLYVDGVMWGICALNPVTLDDTPFHRYLPLSVRNGRRMIEVNNVILTRNRNAGPWLNVMLYRSVCEAIRLGFDLVVGITRFQTLKYFIDSGATPVYHPPLHLLGRDDVSDFIIYYDATDGESVDYLLRHIPRTIDACAIYAKIKTDFLKHRQHVRAA